MEKEQGFKKWELKVSVHCDGCARKVKKVLQNVDGVCRVSVDTAKQKVIVEGDSKMNPDHLIKKLAKMGKPAELCSEDTRQKSPNDSKKMSESSENIMNISGGAAAQKQEKKKTDEGRDQKQSAGKKAEKEKDGGCNNNAASVAPANCSGGNLPPANGGCHVADVRQVLTHPLPVESLGTLPLNPSQVHYTVQYHAVDPYAVVQPYNIAGNHPYGYVLPLYPNYGCVPPATAYQPPPNVRFNTDMFNDENTHSCTLM